MGDRFFFPVLRLTAAEILGGLGWLVLLLCTVALYFGAPLFLPVEGGQFLVARGQCLVLMCWIAGLHSVATGGRFGGLQVSRGSNLFFRGCGSNDTWRFLAISISSTCPLLACLVVSSVLLVFGHWMWGTGLVSGSLSVLQFFFLFYLPFLASTMVAVGIGSRVSGGAGTVSGLVFFLGGALLPPLVSFAAGVGPVWIEILWSVLPHFYALDWSPAAVYLWSPAPWGVFGKVSLYGLLWVALSGSFGGLLFSLSESRHE